MDFMKQYKDETYALLRIVSGFLFIFHGIPKMEAIMDGQAGWMYYLAGPIEVVGGLMIMVGFYTSAAAFLSSGLMAGAYWHMHFKLFNLFSETAEVAGGWPIDNRGELAVMFCFAFLCIAAKGSGIWSVDSKRS